MVDEYKPLAQEIYRNKPLKTKYLVNGDRSPCHYPHGGTAPDLSGPDGRINDLVVRRFLAVLMHPHEYEEIRLTMIIGGETFTAKTARSQPGLEGGL